MFRVPYSATKGIEKLAWYIFFVLSVPFVAILSGLEN
jgi:hypothetical protein